MEEKTLPMTPHVADDATSSRIASQKVTPSLLMHTGDNRVQWAVVYIIAAAVSLFARLVNIGFADNGKTPVFDEKHYATQAHQMMFNPGNLEDFPGYGLVVHPPLGKFFISIGEHIFGYNPLGWRLSSIIAGVIIILLVMRMVHIITNSIAAVTFTAIAANVEGTQLFMSRIAMLDIFMALFVTLMAVCILEDFTSKTKDVPWHRRGWLCASGIFAGLAMAVKVSGVFYPAFMGVALVVIVAVSSRSVRETSKALGMGLVFYLVVPLTIFFLSWVPWFSQENSVYRHVAQSGDIEHPLPQWLARILPDSFNSFASYQIGVAKFHTSLDSGPGIENFHPWESKPDQWFMGARPMLFLSTHADADKVVFGSGEGEARMMLVANMALWVLIIPVIAWGVYHLIAHRKPHWFIILSGFAIGIIPWFIAYDRQQYFFYTVSWSMFIPLGVAVMLHEISVIVLNKTSLKKNTVNSLVYIPYTVLIVAVFALYIPWFYNIAVSTGYHDMLTLFDNWKQLDGYSDAPR